MALMLIASIGTIPHGNAADLTGQATVIDGDTLEMQGTRVGLYGIDAPELDQMCTDDNGPDWQCGRESALQLADHIGRQTVTCTSKEELDQFSRVIAVCTVGGEDLAAWLVKEGWALAYFKYSDECAPEESPEFCYTYAFEDIKARIDEIGIWRGTFVMPWDWRKGVR